MVSNLCDSCKSATATLFCRADSAFLCVNCDTNIHAANKLASLHARVWVCEVCEHAPAHVTCKAEAAALCVTCDRDIHSANPLARRHQRVPVTPFYDSVNSSGGKHKNVVVFNFLDDEDRYFNDVDRGGGDVSREEAEAALWLLPNQKVADLNTDQAEDPYVFSDLDPYLDLDYGHVDPKLEAKKQNSSGTDGVVPKETKNADGHNLVNDACIDLDFSGTKSYGYGYKYNNSHAQCLSQSVSPSSLDVGVVPDGGSATMDVTNPYGKGVGVVESRNQTVQISSADREARVSRYRERRKNRKFEKMIRYASRKAYAEMRPRIKGRFAKRTDIQLEAADRRRRSSSSIYGFSVVPSF